MGQEKAKPKVVDLNRNATVITLEVCQISSTI